MEQEGHIGDVLQLEAAGKTGINGDHVVIVLPGGLGQLVNDLIIHILACNEEGPHGTGEDILIGIGLIGAGGDIALNIVGGHLAYDLDLLFCHGQDVDLVSGFGFRQGGPCTGSLGDNGINGAVLQGLYGGAPGVIVYGYIDAHGIQQLAQNGIDAGALGAQTDGLAF